jgi:hypothetical protein
MILNEFILLVQLKHYSLFFDIILKLTDDVFDKFHD